MTNKKMYTGIINIGLQKRYSGEYYKKENYIDFIKQWQLARTADHQLMFCPAIYEFDFVCGNLAEKHLALKYINYPKQLVGKKIFRKTVLNLAAQMMEVFSQNRILIEFSDRNVLLEADDATDPKIK